MQNNINRRKALITGAASAGLFMGACAQPSGELTENASPGFPLDDVWGEDFLMQWSPPGNLERDLTPGSTPVRLSCAGARMRLPGEGESFGDVVKSIRDAGFTACESSDRGWDQITDSQIGEMQAALKEYDIDFYGIHIVVNIIDPDEARARENRARIARGLELAERLGLKVVVTHTGGRHPKNKDMPHVDNWTRETWEMSVNALKQILNDTRGGTVPLGVEAVNCCNNNTPESHVRLKQDVGDDRIKVTLDPCNMFHAGTYFRTTELINRCFDLLGEDIVYGHAKDKVWTDMMPNFQPAILGQGNGNFDYATYLVRLSRLSYTRALLIEHLPADQYPPSRQYLLDTAKQVGVRIYGEV